MSSHAEIYRNEAAMEPLLPQDPSGKLREAASRLLTESAKLSGMLHPTTQSRVAELVRHMNSYYSNLIEGHHTHPADIEKALKNDYSTEPAKRALQFESAAHVQVEVLMQNRSRSAGFIASFTSGCRPSSAWSAIRPSQFFQVSFARAK
jgi:hypothetical protein